MSDHVDPYDRNDSTSSLCHRGHHRKYDGSVTSWRDLGLETPAVLSEQSVTQQQPLCVTSSRDVCIGLFALDTIVPSVNAIRTLNVDLQMSVVVDQQQKSVNLLSEGTSMSQRSPPPPPLGIGRLGRGFPAASLFLGRSHS